MKLCKSVLIIILTAVLSSCSSQTNSAEPTPIPTPDIGTDVQVGKYLEVTAPNGWNSFKTNEPISLEIRNISKNQITSGPDLGARIFVRTEKEWIEVINKENYQHELLVLEPTENYDPLKTVATFILPDLPDYSVKTYIRIYVVGNLMENGNETTEVGSYIDLELKP